MSVLLYRVYKGKDGETYKVSRIHGKLVHYKAKGFNWEQCGISVENLDIAKDAINNLEKDEQGKIIPLDCFGGKYSLLLRNGEWVSPIVDSNGLVVHEGWDDEAVYAESAYRKGLEDGVAKQYFKASILVDIADDLINFALGASPEILAESGWVSTLLRKKCTDLKNALIKFEEDD